MGHMIQNKTRTDQLVRNELEIVSEIDAYEDDDNLGEEFLDDSSESVESSDEYLGESSSNSEGCNAPISSEESEYMSEDVSDGVSGSI